MTDIQKSSNTALEGEDRRQFLETCGRFAIVTPPAITLLLSTSMTSTAIAQSGGRSVDGGGRSHDHDHDHDHDYDGRKDRDW
jgi:hypothetical protein